MGGISRRLFSRSLSGEVRLPVRQCRFGWSPAAGDMMSRTTPGASHRGLIGPFSGHTAVKWHVGTPCQADSSALLGLVVHRHCYFCSDGGAFLSANRAARLTGGSVADRRPSVQPDPVLPRSAVITPAVGGRALIRRRGMRAVRAASRSGPGTSVTRPDRSQSATTPGRLH